jgi:hypothetical protein
MEILMWSHGVTRILEFVAESSEDLNTCAMISRVFRLSRNDLRFDLTRTGTIIIKTFLGNIPREVWQRWDQQVFTGNRVRLVAILTQLQPGTFISEESDMFSFALTNIREVVLQRHSSEVPERISQRERGGREAVGFFKKILPNLDIPDIGALAVTASDLFLLNFPGNALWESRASIFRCTAKVVYRERLFALMQPFPFPLNNNMNNLHELHLDPFGVYLGDESPPISAYCQEYSQLDQDEWSDDASYSTNAGSDWVLLREYPNLERVSLKHATYLERHDSCGDYWKELPQEALIKFVRQTPKLRWFCSDLTLENIAILKEERSEGEFCN